MVMMGDYLVSQVQADGSWAANTGSRPQSCWWWFDWDSCNVPAYSLPLTAYNIMSMAKLFAMTGNITYRDVLTRAAQTINHISCYRRNMANI